MPAETPSGACADHLLGPRGVGVGLERDEDPCRIKDRVNGTCGEDLGSLAACPDVAGSSRTLELAPAAGPRGGWTDIEMHGPAKRPRPQLWNGLHGITQGVE